MLLNVYQDLKYKSESSSHHISAVINPSVAEILMHKCYLMCTKTLCIKVNHPEPPESPNLLGKSEVPGIYKLLDVIIKKFKLLKFEKKL